MRPALLAVLLCACATREAGLEVEVAVTVAPFPVSATRLEVGRLSVTSVRGVPCTDVMASLSPLSTAWAHGAHPVDASPLRAETAVDLDLLTPGTTLLATVRPPPGLWCAVELGLGVSASDATWGGTSLLIIAHDATTTRRYLSTSARAERLVMVPLVLSETSRHHRLIAGLDPAALSSLQPSTNDARRELLDTLLASLTLHAVETLK